MTIELRFQPYRLFPYERELAKREVSKLGLRIVSHDNEAILASGSTDVQSLSRLTYFQEVMVDGTRVEPRVATIEKRHLQRQARRGAQRQATRYLVHGLHEYKGKFHPQLVRAFANVLDVQPGDLLIDPFVGSGTTLVEATMLGAKSAGADLSPIAVLLTRAKLSVLAHKNRPALAASLDEWASQTSGDMANAYASKRSVAIEGIEARSEAFLASWFDPAAFASLTVALQALRSISNSPAVHELASVAISSILRRSSLQAPEDLRVRRRSSDSIPEPIVKLFDEAVAKSVEAIRETAELESLQVDAVCKLMDVTSPGSLRLLRGKAESAAVITSPPYATALPYIDTDRLSLVALGLGGPSSLRGLESALIGSREWAVSQQREWDRRLSEEESTLPPTVIAVCQAIKDGHGASAGFRKRAVPALLLRYFTQMQVVLTELRLALRPGERAVFIVGTNRTGSGPDRVTIDTPNLLGQTAAECGFVLDEVIPLETWPRYGLHHANSVPNESAVMLTAV